MIKFTLISLTTICILLSSLSGGMEIKKPPCSVGEKEVQVNAAFVGSIACMFDRLRRESRATFNSSNALCYLGDTPDLNCSSTCMLSQFKNDSRIVRCNGDQNYCSRTQCNLMSGCYCKSESIEHLVYADCGDGWFRPDKIESAKHCLSLPTLPDPSRVTYNDIVRRSEVLIDNSNSTHFKLTLSLTASNKRLPVVFLKWKSEKSKKQRDVQDQNPENSIYTILNTTLDEENNVVYVLARVDMDVFEAITYHQEGANVWNRRNVRKNDITPDELCSIGRCEHCETNPQWAMCKSYNFGYINTAMVIIGLILALCLLPWIVAVMGLIKKFVCCCIKGPKLFCKCCTKTMKDVEIEELRTMVHENSAKDPEIHISERSEEDSNESDDSSTSKIAEEMEAYMRMKDQERRRKTEEENKKTKRFVQAFVVCFFMFSVVNIPTAFGQCSPSVISSSQIKTCTVYNSSHSVCDTNPTIQVAITGIGSESCITLITENNTYAGKITTKLVDLVVTQTFAKDYYTSCFNGAGESSKSCFKESDCCTDSYTCQNFNSGPRWDNPCGKFSASITNAPGKTYCDNGCYCITCGCFFCTPSCMYSRQAFHPTGEVFKVLSPSTYITTASILITTEFNQKQTLTLSSTQPFTENAALTATFQGIFVDFGINFGGKKLVTGNFGAKFVDASQANIPSADSIGDIQANLPQDLVNYNVDSVRFSPNIMSRSVGTDYTSFSFRACGASYIWNYPSLPTTNGGFLWDYVSENTISTRIMRSLTATLTLTLKGKYSFFQTDDVVCPTVKATSISGCFSCAAGATVILSVQSTCQPGTCVVSFGEGSTLSTNVIELSRDLKTVNLTVLTSQRNFNDTIRLNCGRNSATAKVVGTLIDPKTIYDLGNETQIGGASPSERQFDFSLFGLNDVYSKLVLAVIVIGSVLLIALIVFIVVRYIIKRRTGNVISVKDAMKAITGITAVSSAWKGYKPLSTEEEMEKDPTPSLS